MPKNALDSTLLFEIDCIKLLLLGLDSKTRALYFGNTSL